MSLDSIFSEISAAGYCIVSLSEDYNSLTPKWLSCLSYKHKLGDVRYANGSSPYEALHNALHNPKVIAEPIHASASALSLDEILGPTPQPKINHALIRRFTLKLEPA